ncbi:MAG TPA: hypothetical protein VK617_06520, partial [Gemmatimonadaceae bacterium]|nr:hypothetical protein [Gemmatimonadaceae bacterium]
QGALTLQIVNAAGKVVRTYSSTDRVLDPDPARDPEAYNRVCQKNPKAPDCNLPMYWAAPTVALSAQPGMHRAIWDLRYNPVADERDDLAEDENGNGAVPHRTFPAMDAPWAPPGVYTVRLTASGKRLEQPLTLRLDPRVKTPAVGLSLLASLSTEMYDDAVATRAAYTRARALRARLESASAPGAEALRARVDSIAPEDRGEDRGARARRARDESAAPPTLRSAGNELMAAAMSMQGADNAPTANQIAACARARARYRTVIARWSVLEKTAHASLGTN